MVEHDLMRRGGTVGGGTVADGAGGSRREPGCRRRVRRQWTSTLKGPDATPRFGAEAAFGTVVPGAG